MMRSSRNRQVVTIVIAVWLAGLCPAVVHGQKFINFSTTGTIRSTLVFGNQIVPDVYLFFAQAGETIRLETSNSSFDTTLRVVGPDAAFDIFDDDSGIGTNSRIHFTTPDTGGYIVIVSSFSGNPGGGTYDLTIARGAAAKSNAIQGEPTGQFMPELENPVEVKVKP